MRMYCLTPACHVLACFKFIGELQRVFSSLSKAVSQTDGGSLQDLQPPGLESTYVDPPVSRHSPSLWPIGLGAHLGQNRLQVRVRVVSEI